MSIKILDRYELIEVPSSVAVCPICGLEVVIDDVDEYEQDDDGLWRVSESGLSVNCVTEPDIDSFEWNDWLNGHWSMPYVDWLPITVKVWQWLDSHYRFNLERG